jgi:hypothetical protein
MDKHPSLFCLAVGDEEKKSFIASTPDRRELLGELSCRLSLRLQDRESEGILKIQIGNAYYYLSVLMAHSDAI